MRLKPTLLAAGLAVATVVSGCVGQTKSDFPVVVVNKIANTLQVLVNGTEIGQVTGGQTGSFSVNLAQTNPNQFTNGVAPTAQAEVIISAKDLKTGNVSTAKSTTLSQSAPTYVTFSASDFASSVQPVARFTNSPVSPGVNEDISFNASSSTVSGGGGTFSWDFGDNTTATGMTVIHQYNRAATFTVLLTVTSETGQTATTSRPISVSAALPPTAAQFTFSPATPGVNQTVIFVATTQAAAGWTFIWDFGDGSGPGTGQTVTHVFTRAATYTVMLRVANGGGQTASSSKTITAAATSPQVVPSFTFSPILPGINQDVFFNAIASTPSNATFAWNFGDGSLGTGVAPIHRFALPATYTVTLTVTNDIGQSNTTSRTVTVTATSTALVASFTFSPIDPNLTRGTNHVIFDATGSSPTVTAWAWDYGDGTTDAGPRQSHLYTQAGTWVVRLTVTDASGRTQTVTKNVTVSP